MLLSSLSSSELQRMNTETTSDFYPSSTSHALLPPRPDQTLGQLVSLSIAQLHFYTLLIQLFFEYLVLRKQIHDHPAERDCFRFSQPAIAARNIDNSVFKALFLIFRKSLASRTVPKIEPLTLEASAAISKTAFLFTEIRRSYSTKLDTSHATH